MSGLSSDPAWLVGTVRSLPTEAAHHGGNGVLSSPEGLAGSPGKDPPGERSKGTSCTHVNVQIFGGGGRMGLGEVWVYTKN